MTWNPEVEADRQVIETTSCIYRLRRPHRSVQPALPLLVDNVATNQRGDARYATRETNGGVRVVAGFLDFWQPSTLLVDTAVTAAAQGSFPAVVAFTWSGIPGDATDGRLLNTSVLSASCRLPAPQRDFTERKSKNLARRKPFWINNLRGSILVVGRDGLEPSTNGL